jgi:hypothetical protein
MGAVAPPAAADLRAEQITRDSVQRTRIGGPGAIAGIGDWYLANEIVEVVVDDPSRRHAKLNHGGTIVDVGLRDRRDEDQFGRLLPVANASQRVILGYDTIRAERDASAGRARLVVASPGLRSLPRGSALDRRLDLLVPAEGELDAVRVATIYEVRRGEPFVRIETTFTNEGDTVAPLYLFGEFWMRGERSIRAFGGDLRDPARAPGFSHVGFDPDDSSTALEALSGLTYVSAPGTGPNPPIAYALFSPDRHARGLPFLALTSKNVSILLGLTGDPPWTGHGLLDVLGSVAGLEPGASWTYSRILVVGERADVASTSDTIFRLAGVADGSSGIEGRVAPRDVRTAVHVTSAEGHPVTQAVTDSQGRYRAALPPGAYRLTLRAPHRAPRRVDVRVGAGAITTVPEQRFEETGWLVFDAPFDDGGPGRVVVRGIGSTPDPKFDDELLDARIGGVPNRSGTQIDTLYFTGGVGDPSAVPVAPGRYRLTAVRGLEFDAAQHELRVPGPGARVAVPAFAMERIAALPGSLRADLHVHAESSDDTSTPNAQRLRQFVAGGVDVLVASDHDNLGDWDGALRASGLSRRLHLIRGVEVTSSTPSFEAPWSIGHHNAWPVRRDPLAHRGGTPPSQELTLGALYSSLRVEYRARVVQLNHARGRVDGVYAGNFFTHLGSVGAPFDPALPVTAEGNRALLEAAPDGTRAIDFDVMEIANGHDWHQSRLQRRDWYSLLRQGYHRTGTANSDSHGPDRPAGFPRNYVFLGGDGAYEPERFEAALLAGGLFGTNGPLLVHFAVNGARSGERAQAPGGRVMVEYEVTAAPWVPVDEVRLLVNGEVVRILEPRFGVVELDVAADAFLTLEAGAPIDVEAAEWARTHPGLYSEVIAPDFVPFAFSNPVYLDVDGNGAFDPPGLPPPPPSGGVARGALLVLALALYGLWRRRRRVAPR